MTPSADPDDILAIELAFGLLTTEERTLAGQRASRDDVFALSLRTWQRRAVAMISLPMQTPRPSLWSEIARRTVGGADADGRARRSVRMWRGVSAFTTMLAAASIVLFVSSTPSTKPALPPREIVAPTELALLTGSGPGAMAIGYHGARRPLTVVASGVQPGDREAQLWLVPRDGRPVSLGVLDLRGDRAVLRLSSSGRLLDADSSLAVSLEPAGGSPTGLPTGPIILSGKFSAGDGFRVD